MYIYSVQKKINFKKSYCSGKLYTSGAMIFMVTCGFTSLDPGSLNLYIEIAESIGSGSKIKPYQFEPVHMGFSNSEDDSSESETDILEQASFTECLGTIDWCNTHT